MKVLVIANPIAGRGCAERRGACLANRLEERGHGVDWFITRRRGDASRRARELEGKIDRIVVAGGDGTLNEVVNGLADPSRTPLAYLALGTGNMLARELRIPRKPERLLELVESGAIHKVDLGCIGAARFLMVASSGFDAMVTKLVRASRTGPLGYLGYLRPILKTLSRYRAPKLEVSVDGDTPLSSSFVVVGNIRNYGGIFSITDRARCDSGHLDICIFRHATIPDLVRYALAASAGGVSRLDAVEYRTGRRIEIAGREPVPVQVDGDHWGTTPIVIEVEPATVPILVPRPERAAQPSFGTSEPAGDLR